MPPYDAPSPGGAPLPEDADINALSRTRLSKVIAARAMMTPMQHYCPRQALLEHCPPSPSIEVMGMRRALIPKLAAYRFGLERWKE
jgi:hypothetical protein